MRATHLAHRKNYCVNHECRFTSVQIAGYTGSGRMVEPPGAEPAEHRCAISLYIPSELCNAGAPARAYLSRLQIICVRPILLLIC